MLPSKIIKEITHGDFGRHKLLSGITKMTNAVKSTLGPGGSTVLIEDQMSPGGFKVTKDGVSIAKVIELEDAIESMAVSLVKRTAMETAKSAGDGTTSSTVLAHALLVNLFQEKYKRFNKTALLRRLKSMSSIVSELLCDNSIPVTVDSKQLYDTALISSNGDKRIAELISEAYRKSGSKDAIIIPENSRASNMSLDMNPSFQMDSGYLDPAFINDFKSGSVNHRNAYILISNQVLDRPEVISNIVQAAHQDAKLEVPVIIIGEVSPQLKNTMLKNLKHRGGKFELNFLSPPMSGWRQTDILSDLALMTGGTFFDQASGNDINTISVDAWATHLGVAEQVITTQTETNFRNPYNKQENNEDANPEMIDAHISELRGLLESKDEEQIADRKFLEKRIANLQASVFEFKTGGATEAERGELYDRIEDAIYAVRAALDGGVVGGAGTALLEAGILAGIYKPREVIEQDAEIESELETKIEGFMGKIRRFATKAALIFRQLLVLFDFLATAGIEKDAETIDEAASEILRNSLTSTSITILANAGLSNMAAREFVWGKINGATSEDGFSLDDWVNGSDLTCCSLKETGIIDPLNVVRDSFMNAVSVSTTVFSTEAIVNFKRESNE